MPLSNEDFEKTLPYLLFKHSAQLFQKPWSLLEPEDREKVSQKAQQELSLQQAVLASPEAHEVTIQPETVEQAIGVIRKRFSDEESFHKGLEGQGLSESVLCMALENEILVDGVVEKVRTTAAQPTEEEVEAYYQEHLNNFEQPERRAVSHILITINDDFPDNTRNKALERIEKLQKKLDTAPEQFPELARLHSECPSSLKDGSLGTVQSGKLYPALDKALFSMDVNKISPVLETDNGFHILLCEQVIPATRTPQEEALRQVRMLLLTKMKQQHSSRWLKSLIATEN